MTTVTLMPAKTGREIARKAALAMKRSLRLFLVVLLASNFALAADNEFRGVVSAIESHYGVQHTHIPLLGLALFFVRPEGISGLKLAVFENFHPRPDRAADDVRNVVERQLGPDWHIFVHTHSRDDNENTLIYTNFCNGKMQMLVINLESDEATIVQMNLSDRAMRHWMHEPGEHAKNDWSSNHHRSDD